MKRTAAFTVLVLACFLLASIMIEPRVYSASPKKFFIEPSGNVEPSSAPIQRNGDNYTLTADLSSQLVIERGGIIFDGAGYTFQGSGSGVAINMTCSNTTVENVNIIHWDAGVLGVFDNNTIKDSYVTQCSSAFKIYAKHYAIVDNRIENNDEAVRIGQGGFNLIAGNQVENDGDGLALYDSNNLVVDNNFYGCVYEAIYLDSSGWDQIVFHNNFFGNVKDVVDATRDDVGRPTQASVLPWDNGSSGNYWSNYTGTDINGDGIGDSPFKIPTTYGGGEPDSNSFVDRYPLMTPYTVNSAAVPTSTPTQVLQADASGSSRSTTLSFLQNVIKLNLTQYSPSVVYGAAGPAANGVSTDYLSYELDHFPDRVVVVDCAVTNGKVTSISVDPLGRELFGTYKVSNSFDTALNIMQSYQSWINDPEVGKMVQLLNMAGSLKNATEQAGNMDLKMSVTAKASSFDWSITYGGVDYSGVGLTLDNSSGVSSVSFGDDRSVFSIGDTAVNVSEQQAVNAADSFVSGYSYKLDFSNGTTATVKGLGINATDVSAQLTSQSLGSATLYPYWRVQVPLAHVYPQETYAVTVYIKADTGVVFEAQRDLVPTSPPNIQQVTPLNLVEDLIPSFATLICSVAAALVIAFAIVLLVARSEKKKAKQHQI